MRNLKPTNDMASTNEYMQAHAKMADGNYPELPKNGSLNSGEKLISEVLWNSLSAAENGREPWGWRLGLDVWWKWLQMSKWGITSDCVQAYTNTYH